MIVKKYLYRIPTGIYVRHRTVQDLKKITSKKAREK